MDPEPLVDFGCGILLRHIDPTEMERTASRAQLIGTIGTHLANIRAALVQLQSRCSDSELVLLTRTIEMEIAAAERNIAAVARRTEISDVDTDFLKRFGIQDH
jgi:capsule polysaccharide export protein KpsE/RkpR